MGKIISGEEIKKTLKNEVQPEYIAVAYVGIDWEDYIADGVAKLKEIIVSPTFGSNPRAIRQLVDKLGWDKVHFLKQLHAKIYIGEKLAAIGSFNLTKNGLGAETDDLEEAGVLLSDLESVKELADLYKGFEIKAKRQFPTTEGKKKALAELEHFWNLAISNDVLRKDNTNSSLANYEPLTDTDFYVCGYLNNGEWDEEVVKAEFQEPSFSSFKEKLQDYISFRESDNIKEGSWVLSWKQNKDGQPNQNGAPRWIYIHKIVQKGLIGEDHPYTKVAIELKHKKIPPPPFDIGANEKEAIKKVLRLDKFNVFRTSSNEGEWSVEDTFKHLKEFVSSVKNNLI
ncbi:phospholipase D family protein [Ferrovum myxofaciens]|uniref:phospholipase D family protein n=1 Tax=Ferrovum myxofaciens TaxID=416213 RepID=UPI0023534FF1|nr:phospholipase D family protein [Ferrovum myxofaciens]MBU6993505.1 phospholipase D family protein [Ferrovum myxofaciens]